MWLPTPVNQPVGMRSARSSLALALALTALLASIAQHEVQARLSTSQSVWDKWDVTAVSQDVS